MMKSSLLVILLVVLKLESVAGLPELPVDGRRRLKKSSKKSQAFISQLDETWETSGASSSLYKDASTGVICRKRGKGKGKKSSKSSKGMGKGMSKGMSKGTSSPTASPAPSESPAPSNSPTMSAAPSDSPAPSGSPTTSPAPSQSLAPTRSKGGMARTSQPTALPTMSAAPSDSPAPSGSPTTSPAPSQSLAPTRSKGSSKQKKKKSSKGGIPYCDEIYSDSWDPDTSDTDDTNGSTPDGSAGAQAADPDCTAVAAGTGRTDTSGIQDYEVGIQLILAQGNVMTGTSPSSSQIAASTRTRLQERVAPVALGCSARRLQEIDTADNTTHVNLVFGNSTNTATGLCAGDTGATCLQVNYPASYYYEGDYTDEVLRSIQSQVAMDSTYDGLEGVVGVQSTQAVPVADEDVGGDGTDGGGDGDGEDTGTDVDEDPEGPVAVKGELQAGDDGLGGFAVVGVTLAGVLLLLGILLVGNRARKNRHQRGSDWKHYELDTEGDDDGFEYESDGPRPGHGLKRQVHVIGEGNSVITTWSGESPKPDEEGIAEIPFDERGKEMGVHFVKPTLPDFDGLPKEASRNYVQDDTVEL